MNISPFTVVHSGQTPATLTGLSGNGTGFPQFFDSIEKVVQRIDAPLNSKKRTSVGLWDLGSMVGKLPDLIASYNRVQTQFIFVEVFASIPSSLVSPPERMKVWAEEQRLHGWTVDEEGFEDLMENALAEDFFERAKNVRNDIGIDYLIGLIPLMVAFNDEEDKGHPHWNYISMNSPQGNLILVSTYEFPDYAKQNGLRYEVLVGWAVLAQLLQAVHPDKGLFHPDNKSCLFDFNEERFTIGAACQDFRIETTCLNELLPRYRKPAQAMISALRELNAGVPKSD